MFNEHRLCHHAPESLPPPEHANAAEKILPRMESNSGTHPTAHLENEARQKADAQDRLRTFVQMAVTTDLLGVGAPGFNERLLQSIQSSFLLSNTACPMDLSTRTFIREISPGSYRGDIWVQGYVPSIGQAFEMSCIVSRNENFSYVIRNVQTTWGPRPLR
jgi:hypothetical protein